MWKKWNCYIVIITFTTTLLTGCGLVQNNKSEESADTQLDTVNKVETIAASISEYSQVIVDTEFAASDLEVGYEDSDATYITLKDKNISVSGTGTGVEENVVTIKEQGTYVISGTLEEGQIVVDAESFDEVHIILNGVFVTCLNNAPIYIKNADKVFITLEENTENTLMDGFTYNQTDDNQVNGVIFSMTDLTINGSGTLNICGNYKYGIASTNDLVITGGIYNITAVNDVLNGKNCVKIKDGTFFLSTTSGNGIQSKNSDDSTKGYVYICGGDITVSNCIKGVDGTLVVIEGGILAIAESTKG
ncbi:MAG: carbohydrate-binding domain-containing protein [Velocimicrobium sp.]